MTISELLANATPVSVTKGKNLSMIGWHGGYLVVRFRGRPTQWIYGPGIPEEEFSKIMRVPYPDKLFTSNIKNKYQCHKIGA